MFTLYSNRLVRSITRHSVVFSKYNSLLGSTALVCCSRYGWSSDSFQSNCIPLSNNFLSNVCLDSLTESEINSINCSLAFYFEHLLQCSIYLCIICSFFCTSCTNSLKIIIITTIAAYSKSFYALRVLRSHGMPTPALHSVYRATVVSKLI